MRWSGADAEDDEKPLSVRDAQEDASVTAYTDSQNAEPRGRFRARISAGQRRAYVPPQLRGREQFTAFHGEYRRI
jgi:hypothetical protein